MPKQADDCTAQIGVAAGYGKFEYLDLYGKNRPVAGRFEAGCSFTLLVEKKISINQKRNLG